MTRIKWTIGVIGALALALASPAIAADASGYGMYGIKIAVKDPQKTIDFYTKLGMKAGPVYNAAERALEWNNPAQGSNIILVHDDTGRMKLTPGTAYLMIQVPDAKVTAKALRDSGYPDVGEPRETTQSVELMIKDPDGNQIEMLSPPHH